MTSNTIYISKLPKTKEMLKKEKLHLELNNYCESIKILLSKANIRQKELYKMLLPVFRQSGLFCNKDNVPKSFSTFRRYLNPSSNGDKSNINHRKLLIYFIFDYVLRSEDIEFIWLTKIKERERQIRKLENMIESDYPEPINISDETLKDFIQELESKGLKIKN